MRAFVSPISDDLPAIIPLTIGFFVFFATFSTIMMRYVSIEKSLEKQMLAQRIARVFVGDGLIFEEEFREACERTKVYLVPFEVRIIDDSGNDVWEPCQNFEEEPKTEYFRIRLPVVFQRSEGDIVINEMGKVEVKVW